jgi:Cft2 family RNA processing exonuclease
LPRTEELGNKIRKQGLDFDDAVGEVLGEGFSYIIASPAMLTSGWSRNFLENMVDDPRHAIILSGYMPKHAGGIPRLHHLAQGDEIDLAGDRRKILAKWERAPALSAHAPSQDLRQFADYMIRQGDRVAFGMVHGDPAAQEALADDVEAMPGASAESLNKGQVWRPQRPS